MKIKVICKKCDRIFNWNAEKEIELCPYCDSELTIKDVRMNPSELLRYKKYKKENRRNIPDISEEPEEKTNTPVTQSTLPRLKPTAQLSAPEKNEIDDLEGKYIIRKGKTKYGTLELTNPDYMILKISFWAMGPQQKTVTTSLTKKIVNELIRNGFDFKKR